MKLEISSNSTTAIFGGAYIAIRKDPSKKLNHFILKKKPVSTGHSDANKEFLMFLEEQDANELGLNVIWIEDFSEVGKILKKIADR